MTAPAASRATGARLPVSGAPDLWCTYAAVRTLAWLGAAGRTPHRAATAAYVRGRRNADGGYAWSRGMPSDAWATFYCVATLADLGEPPEERERTASWVRGVWSGEAYAMTPGQRPDVWATHFATRTAVELCDDDVPDRSGLLAWLGALQTGDGGLSWSPEHAEAGDADARACFYGVAAWRALNARRPAAPPWDVPALVRWLRGRQTPSGGFTFAPDAAVPCLWATYRATGALAALGAAPDADPAPWVLGQRLADGAFTRWPGYRVADVWASFSAVGTLRTAGGVTPEVAAAVERRLAELALPTGGFTYREADQAADALHISATALAAEPDAPELPALRRWLEGCRLPNEDGVMYMPGRGAEMRCTLWALAAGAFRDDPAGAGAISAWLTRLQNPDGGFGYWHGRGSDLISTASAVEIRRLVGRRGDPPLDLGGLAAFVDGCDRARHGERGHGNVPGAPATLRSGLHAARVLDFIGRADRAAVSDTLDRHRVRGGGWANQGARLPDLLSTYEAMATADRLGIAIDPGHVRAFLDRTASERGASWSPLAPAAGDPLADCLHRLLRGRLAAPAAALPALTLS
ncbi:prenyltransferase/squalene oxidase repeat-containing protein [Streptomyces sp. PT12]|uniref:prenyltransferase/squalene oxidase repeat-containing protein n=1 Tax=Streptomyces sp. PT12 TaxID=1510197 RepID=UPI000DE33114|nr:prenyltransferase/squalene oxidase repeat-containing protein [Streptomyces sp. PT12]RBM19447.1 prenyltransferase [Streptomyces sp. PT12]